jgi:hypothetical protein
MSSQTALFPAWKVYGKQELQSRFDVAVVMPTVLRDSILEAVKSIYAQTDVQRIQLLIGIDCPIGNSEELEALLEATPDHVTPCVFYPGYSTSVRHGGLHLAKDGGAIRTILSYLANAQYVAYLDDDNYWAQDHLCSLLKAIQGHRWAFAYRCFLHPQSRKPICVDNWESVGPGLGMFKERFGGWVDPNCLLIDKTNCESALPLWTTPLTGDTKGMSADRRIYNWLQNEAGPPATNDLVSVFYLMQENDGIHPYRLKIMGDRYPDNPLLTNTSEQSDKV